MIPGETCYRIGMNYIDLLAQTPTIETNPTSVEDYLILIVIGVIAFGVLKFVIKLSLALAIVGAVIALILSGVIVI